MGYAWRRKLQDIPRRSRDSSGSRGGGGPVEELKRQVASLLEPSQFRVIPALTKGRLESICSMT
jgi:hypothetical protein